MSSPNGSGRKSPGGELAFTIYDADAAGEPGRQITQFSRVVANDEVSLGADGRWLVQDLPKTLQGQSLPKRGFWLGIQGPVGRPKLWAVRGRDGRHFIRNQDPAEEQALLPLDGLWPCDWNAVGRDALMGFGDWPRPVLKVTRACDRRQPGSRERWHRGEIAGPP